MAHPSVTSSPSDGRIWETALDADDATQKEMLGVRREEHDTTAGRQKYVYVKLNSGTALADGDVCCFTDSYGQKVSSTHTAREKYAGVAFGTITASRHGWIQRTGYHDAIKVGAGGTIAAGEGFVMSGTVKVVTRKLLAATLKPIGYAVAADTTTSVEGYLTEE